MMTFGLAKRFKLGQDILAFGPHTQYPVRSTEESYSNIALFSV